MTRRLLAVPAALAACVIAAANVSAEPDPPSGTVGAAAPTTSFAGEITEPTGAAEIYFQEQGTSKGNCEEPVCQEYALKVADPGTTLTVKSEVDEDGFSQTVEIEQPDGTISQTSAADPGTVTAKVKNPKPGDWLIRIYGSDYINGSPTWTYNATVTLSVPEPEPTPDPVATPAPTPNAGGPGPAGASNPPTLTIRAGRISARKVNRARRLALKLSTTAPVRNLQLALSSGKASRPRSHGRARVATLSGTKTVKVRIARKIKRGRLRVTARGVDAQNRPVAGSARLRVRR